MTAISCRHSNAPSSCSHCNTKQQSNGDTRSRFLQHKFQHWIRLSCFKSWTQESYQFLQIQDKKPEKNEIDMTSEQKKP
eukprot:SAG31_NODE_2266_length_6056_cov_4.832466_2_plen_79_part_00